MNACPDFDRGLRWAFVALSAFAVSATLSCYGSTTQEYLDLSIPGIDRSAPSLISPVTDTKIKGLTQTLAWSSKASAAYYEVEIASDSGFAQPIAGSPFRSAANQYTISFPDAYTYYWRVRSGASPGGVYSETNRIHLLGEALLVYCPAATTCSNTGKVGNKSAPYEVIGDAMAEAKALGVTLRVAARGAAAFYDEQITLQSGLTIEGGYSAPNWARDIAANTTEIRSSAGFVVGAFGLGGAATYSFDGFTLQNSSTGINNQTTVDLMNTNASLTISHCTIKGAASGGSLAVHGVRYNAAHAGLRNNKIDGGSGAFGAITVANGSNPVIAANQISGGTGNVGGIAVNITGSTPTLINNTIHGGVSLATAQIFAVSINGSVKPVVSNNTIVNGLAGTGSVGVYLNNGANPLFTNNIVVNTNAWCYWEASTASDFTSLENNLCWNQGSSNMYYNETATTISNVINLEALTDWAGTNYDKARGNLLISGTGLSSNPFQAVPGGWSVTTAAGTTTSVNINTTVCGTVVVGEYIEIANDGVARQVTSKTCGTLVNFTPALASASTAGQEVRYWNNRSSGGSQYQLDYRLAQNGIALATFNMIRYGGKNTSGPNCGSSSPVGKGVGSESCGSVTADLAGTTRTTANASLATNTSATAPCGNGSGDTTNCSTPRAAAEQAVPGGFSMGAYESD